MRSKGPNVGVDDASRVRKKSQEAEAAVKRKRDEPRRYKEKKKKKGAGQWSLDSTLHTPGGRRNPVGTEQVVCLIAWLSGCLAVWVGIAMSTGSSVAQGANPQSLSDWALPDCVVGELEYIGDSRKGVSIRRPGKELGRQCHEECKCESLQFQRPPRRVVNKELAS